MDKKEMLKILVNNDIFASAAIRSLKGKVDEKVAFTCPLCGGEANAFKSSVNGHHRGKCEKCKIAFME